VLYSILRITEEKELLYSLSSIYFGIFCILIWQSAESCDSLRAYGGSDGHVVRPQKSEFKQMLIHGEVKKCVANGTVNWLVSYRDASD
jgi:hypothetical protein